MPKYLIALAIAGVMSAPAAAQSNQPVPNQAQPAAPQMVKKRICEENTNPFSHIDRICKTVMVPANPAVPANNQQPQTDTQMNAGH